MRWEELVSLLSHGALLNLISAYGYFAVGCIIALESIGFPVPGET